MQRSDNRDLFPLSLNQQNIWNLEQVYGGTSINNISTSIRIQGRVDFVALQETLDRVIAQDPTLRTRLVLEQGQVMQYSAPFVREIFPVYDFSRAGEDGLAVWEETLAREALPLLEAPLYRFILFRTGEHTGGVYVKIHHIISDGWSQALICNRIARTYFQILSGEEVDLEEAPSYLIHVEEEREYLSSKHYGRDRRYWEGVLEQGSEPSVLKEVRSAAVSSVGRRLSYKLPQHLNHAIYTFCMQNRVAPFAVFYMALATYFKRIGGADRFTIGVPIFNRTNYRFKQCTGMFVSTLPFISDIDADWSFRQFNDVLAENWLELLRHQRFPFKEICAMAGQQDERLFQIALSYQDSKIYESNDASVMFTGRWHYSGYQAEQLCIHLTNLESIREYAVDYDYLTQFFTEKEIEEFHTCLMNLLMEGLSCPDKPISQLSLLSPADREQVLYTFNRTKRYLERGSVYAPIEKVAAAHGERVALICKGQRQTYYALNERAGELSAVLREKQPDKRGLAAIWLPRNFDLFAAMTAAMRSGWAYLVISDETPVMRVRTILEQSGAEVIFTSRAMALRMAELERPVPAVFVEEKCPLAEIQPPASADPSDLAYVVYTSGSTGTPKGVEISQQSLMNLAHAMTGIYDSGAVLSLCNTGFDAFVLESAAALMNGRTIVLPTAEELESPRRLAALIKGYAVGTLVTTPSRLLALLQEREFMRAMNRVESVICGGEAFPRELLQQLSLCSDARIYNQYGPSEATVAVSHKLLNRAEHITAGAPLQNCRLYVLDKWQNPLPVGVFGELYIGGLCVGKGYRNDPALTAERFIPSPFESGERLYRTGDIACWTEDGEIVLSGRSDHQIKLHGLRVEPQEIISCIASYPGVSSVAVRVLDVAGQSVIAVYYTSEHPIGEMELLTYAAAYLPRYMVPSFACRLSELPLTGNGKVDEAKLPMPDLATGGLGAPVDSVTGKVLAVFAQDLQREIGADDDYFLHGGSSLTAMRTLAEVEELLGCTLRVSDLYACRTARRLGTCIAQRMGLEQELPVSFAARTRIPKAPEQSHYPLTPIQRGIYFQCALDRESVLYNMPGVFKLSAGIDIDRLETAFCKLIAGEPMLRAAFVLEQGMIRVRVAKSVNFVLDSLEGERAEDVFAAFVRPFDVASAPLLRAGVWHNGEERYLFLDTHHLVGDGLTTPILMERLDAYYGGVDAEESKLSYLDYACYLESRGGASEEDLGYWKEHLASLPKTLLLPGDSPRPRQFDHRGAKYVAVLDESLTSEMDRFCGERGISAYTMFMAAFGILLKEVTGRDTFTVGTPVSERRHVELEKVCGPLLSVLPVLLHWEGGMTVGDYLSVVAGEITAMLDHGDCSQEELLSALHLRGELGSNPLYSVTLSMRPFDTDVLSLGGEKLELLNLTNATAKAELGLEVARAGSGYQLVFEYADGLFRQETMAFYGRCMGAILTALMEENTLLGQIDPMALTDRIALFDDPDHLWKPYLNMSIHEIAARTAQLHGDDTAVIFHGERTTRAAMERRACQMANAIAAAGVKKGDKVGLAMKRTPDLYAAMLGILKNGCAYVPLLTSFPENRLSYMVETAKIQWIVTDDAAALPESLREKALTVGDDWPERFRSVGVGPQDLINVLFTSGSTGQPKGVMVRHSSASNLLSNMQEALQGVTGPMMCVTTPVFDIFMTESLLPLAMGRTIILADEEEMLLPYRMAALMERYEAGFIQFTASRLAMCLSNEDFCKAAAGLQFTIVGGEQVSPALVKKFKSCCKGRLVNLYGPTEATVYTTMIDLHEEEDVTIGYPMGNCRVYIMDQEGRRVLPTAQGEMYLAGSCVAAGYLGREHLTAKAFLPDPFVPGEMMYRSGDLGRLRADGRIDCLGRCDKQVKINGQRLEMDEIMNVMLASNLVSQAAIIPASREDSALALHAFCVRQDGKMGEWSDIAEYLKDYLPDYMIPARFHVLAEMPYTVGGKADLTRLKELAEKEDIAEVPVPAVCAAVEESAAAEQEEDMPDLSGPVTEEKILTIWRRVLKGKELRPDQSFFEQGGTSLDTLNVLSLYYNAHWELSIAQFYQNPTARGQAAILSGGEPVVADTPPAEEKAVSAAEQREEQLTMNLPGELDLELPRYVPNCRWKKSEGKILFLTGATGFFGAHLLRALLQRGAEQVICLVRGNEQRLFDALTWYFGQGWTTGMKKRIRAVSGDLTAPLLGLERDTYYALARDVDTLYHAAADVRHFVKNEQELVHNNVAATRAMVDFALTADAPLHTMSTLSVGGEYIVAAPDKRCVFTERDFSMGQNWQENVYVRSKMLSEAAVYDAITNRGLRAKVYRLGRLIWRAEDGVFQRNPKDNMTALLSAAVVALGAFPADLAEHGMDMTNVDIAAEAVAALGDSPLTTLHIMNETSIPAGELFRAAMPALQVLESSAFDALLSRRMINEQDGRWALLSEYVRMQRLHDEKITPLNLMSQAAMTAAGVNCAFSGAEELGQALAAVLEKMGE